MEPYCKKLPLGYAIKYGSNQPHELQRLAMLENLAVASIGITVKPV